MKTTKTSRKKKKNKKIKKNFLLLIGFIIIIMLITLTIILLKTTDKQEKPNNEENIKESIVFLGDSITYGYKLDEFFEEYPIINSGINGDTTEEVLEDLEDRVYKYDPTKIFLLIGINDMKLKTKKEDTIENIKKIAKEIKENNPKVKLYIESIYPIGSKDVLKLEKFKHIKKEDIQEYNKEIEEFCLEENIPYINVYDVLLDEEGDLKEAYTKDGIHLTDLGYFKVTKKLEEYISK